MCVRRRRRGSGRGGSPRPAGRACACAAGLKVDAAAPRRAGRELQEPDDNHVLPLLVCACPPTGRAGSNARARVPSLDFTRAQNEMETLSTLRFGQRAKAIRNRPQINSEKGIMEYKAVRGHTCSWGDVRNVAAARSTWHPWRRPWRRSCSASRRSRRRRAARRGELPATVAERKRKTRRAHAGRECKAARVRPRLHRRECTTRMRSTVARAAL